MTRPLLVHGGPILTMDPANPLVDAVGIVNGRVVHAGTLDDVRTWVGPKPETLDLHGRMATPGLYDAHCHVLGTGLAATEIEINADRVTSIKDIRRLVRERVAGAGDDAWVIGQGYDQANLAEGRHPNRHDLDDIAPHHPVVLKRSCHHIMAVNSAALRAAGIDRNTTDPPGGTIDRDESGEPTGVLRENAMDAVYARQVPFNDDEVLNALQVGAGIFRAHGVTSAADAGVGGIPGVNPRRQLQAYQRAYADRSLPIRVNIMMLIDDTLDDLIALGIRTGLGDEWVRIGNAKLFTDGSIGGRTARMFWPYQDEEANVGLWMEDPELMKEKMIRAHAAGFQLGSHAIGDAAISLLLDTFEEAQRRFPTPNFRPRVEHCSIIDDVMIDRIKAIGAVPIPGTTFLYDMRPVYLENLGEDRVRYAYAMRTFADRGIVAAASTDAPVSLVNPMIGIQMMTTRHDRNGDEIFPEECISLEEAIRAYTWNGAYASMTEGEKGSLEPGKLGDITIFETDLRDVESNTLKDVRVDYTIIGGDIVHDRSAATEGVSA